MHFVKPYFKCVELIIITLDIVWILCHSIKLKISVWAELISKYWCYMWCSWNTCSNSIACYHGVGLHPLSFWVIALVQFRHCRLANLQSDKVSPSIDFLFAPGLVYVCESCRFDMDVYYQCVCVYYLFVIYLWEVSVCVVYVWYVSDWFDSIICQCDCFCDVSKELKKTNNLCSSLCNTVNLSLYWALWGLLYYKLQSNIMVTIIFKLLCDQDLDVGEKIRILVYNNLVDKCDIFLDQHLFGWFS